VPVWPVYAAAALCEALCSRLGIEPPLHRRRVGFFTHHREFDIGKARRVLAYEPRVTLIDGLRRTAVWYAAAGLLAPLKRRVDIVLSLAMICLVRWRKSCSSRHARR
jgi:hypothetical protein